MTKNKIYLVAKAYTIGIFLEKYLKIKIEMHRHFLQLEQKRDFSWEKLNLASLGRLFRIKHAARKSLKEKYCQKLILPEMMLQNFEIGFSSR